LQTLLSLPTLNIISALRHPTKSPSSPQPDGGHNPTFPKADVFSVYHQTRPQKNNMSQCTSGKSIGIVEDMGDHTQPSHPPPGLPPLPIPAIYRPKTHSPTSTAIRLSMSRFL